jgi:hypothetical protein
MININCKNIHGVININFKNMHSMNNINSSSRRSEKGSFILGTSHMLWRKYRSVLSLN